MGILDLFIPREKSESEMRADLMRKQMLEEEREAFYGSSMVDDSKFDDIESEFKRKGSGGLWD